MLLLLLLLLLQLLLLCCRCLAVHVIAYQYRGSLSRYHLPIGIQTDMNSCRIRECLYRSCRTGIALHIRLYLELGINNIEIFTSLSLNYNKENHIGLLVTPYIIMFSGFDNSWIPFFFSTYTQPTQNFKACIKAKSFNQLSLIHTVIIAVDTVLNTIFNGLT